MKDTTLSTSTSSSAVYILVRVFNLGQADKIDMRMYVDPYDAKAKGNLIFTASNWRVEPNLSKLSDASSETIKPNYETSGSISSSKVPGVQTEGAPASMSSEGGRHGPDRSGLGGRPAPSTADVPYVVTYETSVDGKVEGYNSLDHMQYYRNWSLEVRNLALFKD